METWVLITIAAAFLQNIRSGLQKHLRGKVSTAAATFVRFGFGLPFALLFLFFAVKGTDAALPHLTGRFMAFATMGAISQIVAQLLLIILFTMRNFAVGSSYVRTEPVLAALFGVILLGEAPSFAVLVAIAISVLGVMLIALAQSHLTPAAMIKALGTREAVIGLSSAAIFGLAAVSYRGASLALGGPNFIVQGAVTLCFAIALQSAILGAWLYLKEPGQLRKLAQAWKPSVSVGFAGAAASFGWFMAMTLEQAASVKALAQVEMLFAIITTLVIFRETITRRELLGCALIVSGVLILILTA